MGPGGKGSNQAVGVARLGAQAHFAGIIGADKLGEIATDLYAREGVDTTWLKRTTAMATGVGFIILNAEGENGIILDMGANELMDSAYVDKVEEQIARSDVVMSVLEIPVSAAARAMALGKKHGVRTILNPAPATALDGSVLQNVDYLTPNETELRILLGLAPDDPSDTVELARQLRARGVGNLIVTMGEKGALILTEDWAGGGGGRSGRRCRHNRRRGCIQRRFGRGTGRREKPCGGGRLCQPLRRVRLSETGCGSCIGDTGDGWIVVLGFWFLGLVDVC